MSRTIEGPLYSGAGVREYWIVDPEKERTAIYRYYEDAVAAVFAFEQETVDFRPVLHQPSRHFRKSLHVLLLIPRSFTSNKIFFILSTASTQP
ncbi:MAG: Uma2 family endonuclease [Clostridiaceae bacterium]|nr:Uma2 family endonuclease [Clostridiaceae bacterium]